MLASGCFFYDSRWQQETESQERQAAHLIPEAPSATGEGAQRWRTTQTLRVRAWATPRYRAEVHRWQAHVEQLLERVNEVVGPGLRVRLVLAEARPWDVEEGDSLGGLVEALEQQDSAEDVDLVIGFLGSMARLSAAFDTLGTARVMGKHLVVRAMNDAAESDAIDAAFDRLSDEERARLRRRRKAHKELTVLLHEIGHAWGAIHVRDATAVMSPTYDAQMRRYAPETLALLRPVLAERRRPQTDRDGRALVVTLVEALRAGGDAFVAEERDALIARYEHTEAQSDAPAAPSAGPSRDDRAGTLWDVTSLAHADRVAFHEAREAAARQQLSEAWERLSTLVGRYPDTYAVQELACDLHHRRAAPREAARSCERMMDLATSYGRE